MSSFRNQERQRSRAVAIQVSHPSPAHGQVATHDSLSHQVFVERLREGYNRTLHRNVVRHRPSPGMFAGEATKVQPFWILHHRADSIFAVELVVQEDWLRMGLPLEYIQHD